MKIEVNSQDETGQLLSAMKRMVEKLNGVLKEIGTLIQAVQEGKLGIRGNAAAYQGAWGELIGGVNDLIEAVVAPINLTANYVDRISKGDIPPKITETYQGDFNAIKDNLNLLIDSMEEIARMAEEIASGNLTVKVKERSPQDKLMQALATMIQRLTEVVTSIQTAAHQVASGSQELRASSEQISEGTGQINQALYQLNQVIQQNAEAAEEMASTAEELASQAEQLQGTSAFFQLDETAGVVRRKALAEGRVAPQAAYRINVAHRPKKEAKGSQAIQDGARAVGKPGGVVLEMENNGLKGDEQDAEFERF